MMSYKVICPRCQREFKVNTEKDHSKVMKEHEVECPDEFLESLKR